MSRQTVRVNTASADEDGCLIFANECLAAVFVCLSTEHEPDFAGKWFLEHAFGALDDNNHPLFETLDAAEGWVASNLSARRRAGGE